MKKTRLFLTIVLLVCVASVFALSACDFELGHNMDGTDYGSSFEKDWSLELKSEFFEETLENPDFVVTCRNQSGEVRYTETVKGTSSYTLNKDGSEVYAFKKGSHFYVATVSPQGERSYSCSDSSKKGYYADSENGTMEDLYKRNYCSFMNKENGISAADDVPEKDENFRCFSTIEWRENVSSGSLEFTCTAEDRTFAITASRDRDVVQTLCVVITGADGETVSDLTWTFAHGGASVTLPDTDAWDREADA